MGEIVWMAVMAAASGGISYWIGENSIWAIFGGMAGHASASSCRSAAFSTSGLP